MPSVQLNVNGAPIAYSTLARAPVNDPQFANNVITDVAQKCHQEIKDAQLGRGHSLKAVFSTLAYVGPKIALMGGPLGLAYCYRYELLDQGAKCLTEQAAQMSVGALASFGALELAGKKFDVSPVSMGANALSIGANALVNWTMWVYASTVEKLCCVAADSVANSYNKQAQHVEELTSQNHQTILASLSDAYNGLGEDISNRFASAGSLTQKYKVLKVVKKLEKRLPEILQAFAGLGLSKTESARVLEKLMGAIGQIGLSLEADLEDTTAAAIHNYELLVKLSEEISIANCVPRTAVQCLDAAKRQELGFGHIVKGVASATASTTAGAIRALIVPALSAVAVAASQYAGYDVIGKCTEKVCELGVAVSPENLKNVALATTAVTALAIGAMKGVQVQRSYAAERQQADVAVTKNTEAAQVYLNKVFADVLENMQAEDKATVAARLPKWQAEISKHAGLSADAALSALEVAVLLPNREVEAPLL